MNDGSGHRKAGCSFCDLPERARVELDILLASDPTTWPETLLGGLEPPEGALGTSHWRAWGNVRMAQEWLTQHGYADLARKRVVLQNHHDKHLPDFPSLSQSAIDAGVLSDGSSLPVPSLPSMVSYVDYYRAGLAMGVTAMGLITDRLSADTPMDVLLKVAAIGARLAQSQAALVVGKGVNTFLGHASDEEDEEEGFMLDKPSPRHGNKRIRVIDGVRRPVTDEGHKDRADYNERADRIGATRLPV